MSGVPGQCTVYPLLQDEAWLAEQIAAGKTYDEIRVLVGGASRPRVHQVLAAAGLVQPDAPQAHLRNPLLSDREWLEAHVLEGLPLTALAERADASITSVRTWIRRHGLQSAWLGAGRSRLQREAAERAARRTESGPKPPKYPKLRDVEWLAAQKRTRTLAEIAEEVGCDMSSVSRALHRFGIPVERVRPGRPRSTQARPTRPARRQLAEAIAEADHYAYRIFDADDACLYVGSTSRLAHRLSSHRKRSWGDQIARVDVTLHSSADEARDVEYAETTRLKPSKNVQLPGDYWSRRLAPGELIDLVMSAFTSEGPMTQTDCERYFADAGIDNGSAVASVIHRLVNSGRLTIVGERPSLSARWPVARIYAAASAAQAVA